MAKDRREGEPKMKAYRRATDQLARLLRQQEHVEDEAAEESRAVCSTGGDSPPGRQGG